MSKDIEWTLQELLADLDYAEASPATVAMGEEAVRLADLLQNRDYQIHARRELAWHAYYTNHPEISLNALTWVLNIWDTAPELLNAEDVLWDYKRYVAVLHEFPQFSREQIEGVYEDMRKRYEREGLSLRGYWSRRTITARAMGDPRWVEFAQKWQRAPSDGSEDCAACECDLHVRVHMWHGRTEQALKTARVVLDGIFSCRTVPQRTLSNLSLDLLREGDEEKSTSFAKRAYNMMGKNPLYLEHMGKQMLCFTQLRDFNRALRQFEKHVGWLDTHGTPHDHFEFALGARVLFKMLLERPRARKTRKLRLPGRFELFREDGEYAVSELHTWAVRESDRLARAFDERNGNDLYTSRILAPLRQAD